MTGGEPLQPLININEKSKQKRQPLSSFFDEGMEFIIDTYKEGLHDKPTPHAENRARGSLLKKICQKKDAKRKPLLDQIDHIVTDIKTERTTLANGLDKLEHMAQRFASPQLLPGIQQKIQHLRMRAQQHTKEWLSLFDTNIQLRQSSLPQPSRPPLINLSERTKGREALVAQFVSPPKQRKAPPLAAFFQQHDQKQPRKRMRGRKTDPLGQPLIRLSPPDNKKRRRR